MYTVVENARIVLALLKEHNIRHIVLSPGGSNIPIVQGVQQDPFFNCYSVVDERSAMYFAIGLHLQTGEIVATSCTSAQATRNYLPGLTEAFYKRVPILAITISKHPMYLGQDYMQCPIQTSLPVDAVKKSYSLPCINTEQDRYQCIRTANEAILELTHHGNGPVQLNIEVLDSQTWVFDNSINSLPEIRTIRRYHYWDKLHPEELSNKKIMILIGEHRSFTTEECLSIERFSSCHNVFIYTNPTSNYSGKYSLNANLAKSSMSLDLFQSSFVPDIVISIGGLTGDYAIYYSLFNSENKNLEHWRVDLDGNVVDTYNKLTRIYEMRIEDFFNNYSYENQSNHDYYEIWKELVNEMKYPEEIPLSNLYCAMALSSLIPNNSVMTYAIHNSLTVWDFVQIPTNIQAYSPIAAFGIDGALSMSVGTSVVNDNLNFLITGDLAYLYDMNALCNRHIGNNMRVLVCNNNGGIEFKLGDLEKRTDVGSYIAADNHYKNTEGWAVVNGFEYISVKTKAELNKVLPNFVKQSDRPILLEVFVSPEEEREAQRYLKSINWHGTPEENVIMPLKNALRKVVGDNGVNTIKKIIKGK